MLLIYRTMTETLLTLCRPQGLVPHEGDGASTMADADGVTLSCWRVQEVRYGLCVREPHACQSQGDLVTVVLSSVRRPRDIGSQDSLREK